MSGISYFEQVRQAIDERIYACADIDYSERLSNHLTRYAVNILCMNNGELVNPNSSIFEIVINGIANAAIIGSEEIV